MSRLGGSRNTASTDQRRLRMSGASRSYTQLPNETLDSWLAELTRTEFKLALAIWRLQYGARPARCSVRDLARRANLRPATVQVTTLALIARGVVSRIQVGSGRALSHYLVNTAPLGSVTPSETAGVTPTGTVALRLPEQQRYAQRNATGSLKKEESKEESSRQARLAPEAPGFDGRRETLSERAQRIASEREYYLEHDLPVRSENVLPSEGRPR